jgi:CheY-like chemotaxis protein
MNPKIVDIHLADDNEDDVLLVKLAFEQAKMMNIVNAVGDGDEALAYLRREGKYKDAALPGLIMLDINMPRMNGFEVLREIKADPALKHLPVVMLTTSKQDQDVINSYAGGACSFVTKPVGLTEFREAVKRFELYWAFVATIPDA